MTMKWDQGRDEFIAVRGNSEKLVFKCNGDGLYTCNVRKGLTLITTVSDNEADYSTREVKAAQNASHNVVVPFNPGRTDATVAQTDVDSFAVLEPQADGFRNYSKTKYTVSAEEMLLDKAQLLTLTAPEMTVLVGGMRVLNTNYDQSQNGVFTKRQEALSNDFFTNLLDFSTTWKAVSESDDAFIGTDRKTGAIKWVGTRVDLIFGSNTELRAIAEVYGSIDGEARFVKDFVAAWSKVMNLDRFDLASY